jgi:hypothetical protein
LRRFSTCLLALASVLLATDCGTPPGNESTGLTTDSLRSLGLGLSDRLSDGYKRGDWPTVAGMLATDYLGTAPGVQWNLDSLQSAFHTIHFVAFHRDDALVKAVAPGILLVNEDGVLTESQSGQDISGRYRFTNIWVQRGGQWLLAVEQEIPLTPTR